MKTLESLPTLTEDGWVSNPIQILERVFVYYLSTNSSTVSLYRESDRPSIKRVMYSTGKDPEDIASLIRSDLTILLEPYFLETTVETDIREEGIKIIITIEITVIDGEGNTHKLTKNLTTEKNEITGYLDLLLEKNKLKIRKNNA